MNVDDILDSINKPTIQAPVDYIGTDGLLFCGKCRKPKQARIGSKVVSCLCECGLAERDEVEAKARQARIDELRKYCLPVREVWRHTFKNASDAKHITIAARYVAKWEEVSRKNIGIIFWGNTGTGKSFVSQCICNALIDREIPALYISAVDLVSSLMDKSIERETLVRRIRETPLFILDDLGAERDTAFAREQICNIVDARSEAGKPLIASTNYTLKEMKETADPQLQRIFNRILGCCVPVAVVGESRRDAIGAAKLEAAKQILELE